MAIYSVSILSMVLLCTFSYAFCQTSREYQNLNRKINLMRETIGKHGSFELKISALQFEVEDLKLELQAEQKLTAALSEQLLMLARPQTHVNQENSEANVDLLTDANDVQVNITENGYDINELKNEIDELKQSTVRLNEAIINVDKKCNRNHEKDFAKTINHAFQVEKLNRKIFENKVKETIDKMKETMTAKLDNAISKINDTAIRLEDEVKENIDEMKATTTASLDNAITIVNDTAIHLKDDVKENIDQMKATTTAKLKVVEESHARIAEQVDNLNEYTAMTKTFLCGNGTLMHDSGDNHTSCECYPGYNGYHCENADITDCYDVLHIGGGTTSGVYTVRLHKTGRQVRVYCDMTTDGGGWTVFQNRFDGSVDFYKNFLQYEQGFGNLEAEFWLGLTYIEELTLKSENKLRLHLEAADGTTKQRNFQQFWLSAAPDYTLHITSVPGDKDYQGLIYNNGYKFTTYDNDRDARSSFNCGVLDHGGWWYAACSYANLNGEYVTPGTRSSKNNGEGGMTYRSFEASMSLKSTKMMFKRA